MIFTIYAAKIQRIWDLELKFGIWNLKLAILNFGYPLNGKQLQANLPAILL